MHDRTRAILAHDHLFMNTMVLAATLLLNNESSDEVSSPATRHLPYFSHG